MRYPLHTALAVCPMLAIAVDLQLASWMGLVFLATVCSSSLIISLSRNFIPLQLRIPLILMISATVVTAISLILQYFTYDIFAGLGIYIPLLAMNCLVIALAEEVALRHGPVKTVLNIVGTVVIVVLLLIVIGGARQYAGLSSLAGPAGGFLLLGLLLAGVNFLQPVKAGLQAADQ